MKYIIEIEDEPLTRQSALTGETAVYRAKGFNSLVFDKNGLDKLRPLGGVVEDAYDRGYEVGFNERNGEYEAGKETGMNEVWDSMKEICKMTWAERKEIFGEGTDDIFDMYTPECAIKTLKEWKQNRDFEVGDEVVNKKGEHGYVLIPRTENGYMYLSLKDYEAPQVVRPSEWEKTGNKASTFAARFEQMR